MPIFTLPRRQLTNFSTCFMTLAKNYGLTAANVRKRTSTEAAHHLSSPKAALVMRQLSHSTETDACFYQALSGSSHTAEAYISLNRMRQERKKLKPSGHTLATPGHALATPNHALSTPSHSQPCPCHCNSHHQQIPHTHYAHTSNGATLQINQPQVQVQRSSKDCFTVTFAVSLFLGDDATTLTYHQKDVRQHFIDCLKSRLKFSSNRKGKEKNPDVK